MYVFFLKKNSTKNVSFENTKYNETVMRLYEEALFTFRYTTTHLLIKRKYLNLVLKTNFGDDSNPA